MKIMSKVDWNKDCDYWRLREQNKGQESLQNLTIPNKYRTKINNFVF